MHKVDVNRFFTTFRMTRNREIYITMKIFSEEIVEKAASVCKVADLSRATIGEVLLVAQYLEKEIFTSFSVLWCTRGIFW